MGKRIVAVSVAALSPKRHSGGRKAERNQQLHGAETVFPQKKVRWGLIAGALPACRRIRLASIPGPT
jgi:hypothetical protein